MEQPVDIWSVGLTVSHGFILDFILVHLDKHLRINAFREKAWDLLEPKRLFTARDEGGDIYDAAYLAQMIAALGPPPPEFLARNPERKADFWDEQGTLAARS